MDIDKLKEDIESVESDLEYGEYQDQGKVSVNVECLRSVIDFANEAIARQSVKSEEVADAIEQKTITDAMDYLNKNMKQPFIEKESELNDV